MSEFDEVVGQIRHAVASVGLDRGLGDDDLRDVLAFLVKVSQVVDQAFQDVLTLAIELAYLDPCAPSQRLTQLQKELELLTARSHYRESLEICSRLKHLKEQFDEHIRPALGTVADEAEWRQLFWLIEDREGRLIELVASTAWRLGSELEHAQQGKRDSVTRMARELIGSIRPLLADLRGLTNQVLGLSGKPGFLELTRDRSALRRAVNFVIQQGDVHVSGDTYNTRNAGAVGPGAQAMNTTITENYGAMLGGIDVKILADELDDLRRAMSAEAGSTSQFEAVAAISGAQDAAKKGETSSVVTKLKGAGQWAVDVATKIGTTIAAEAIKKSMGME